MIERHGAPANGPSSTCWPITTAVAPTWPRSGTYLRRAGDRARTDYANAAAVDYYRQLLPLVDDAERIDVGLLLGGVVELTGRLAEAELIYADAMDVAEPAE